MSTAKETADFILFFSLKSRTAFAMIAGWMRGTRIISEDFCRKCTVVMLEDLPLSHHRERENATYMTVVRGGRGRHLHQQQQQRQQEYAAATCRSNEQQKPTTTRCALCPALVGARCDQRRLNEKTAFVFLRCPMQAAVQSAASTSACSSSAYSHNSTCNRSTYGSSTISLGREVPNDQKNVAR